MTFPDLSVNIQVVVIGMYCRQCRYLTKGGRLSESIVNNVEKQDMKTEVAIVEIH